NHQAGRGTDGIVRLSSGLRQPCDRLRAVVHDVILVGQPRRPESILHQEPVVRIVFGDQDERDRILLVSHAGQYSQGTDTRYRLTRGKLVQGFTRWRVGGG